MSPLTSSGLPPPAPNAIVFSAYRAAIGVRVPARIRGHKKGLYYLTYFRSEGKTLANLEHDCALNEMILRMMVLKVDPKLVDTMLALARDEHALALQVATQELRVENKPFAR